ncbi:predicted protein [Nematostella vectensis]|uniref:Uncharacterized protein n=1 Tax=Nematostella vectensis TaxID=45351 RepID=A7SU68_NEMVE|nr:predicted protein [Nematostella vectensis]|eukprot:XP_001624842.1 predicted protein [Nematostella vectensis]
MHSIFTVENIATQARRNSDPTPRDCPDSRRSSTGFGRSQSHPGANNSSPCSYSDSCAKTYSVDGLKSYLTRKLKGYGLLHCKSNNLNALKRADKIQNETQGAICSQQGPEAECTVSRSSLNEFKCEMQGESSLQPLPKEAQANGQAGNGCIGDEYSLAIRQPLPQTQNMQMLQMVTVYHASNGNLELNNIVGGNKGRIINPVISETLDQILRKRCGDAVFNNPEVEVKLQHLPEKKLNSSIEELPAHERIKVCTKLNVKHEFDQSDFRMLGYCIGFDVEQITLLDQRYKDPMHDIFIYLMHRGCSVKRLVYILLLPNFNRQDVADVLIEWSQANGQAGHGCIGDEYSLAIRQPPPQTQNMQMLQMVTVYHPSNGNLELNNIVGGNEGRIINPVISETLDQILREHCGDAVFNNPEVEVKLQHLPEKKLNSSIGKLPADERRAVCTKLNVKNDIGQNDFRMLGECIGLNLEKITLLDQRCEDPMHKIFIYLMHLGCSVKRLVYILLSPNFKREDVADVLIQWRRYHLGYGSIRCELQNQNMRTFDPLDRDILQYPHCGDCLRRSRDVQDLLVQTGRINERSFHSKWRHRACARKQNLIFQRQVKKKGINNQNVKFKLANKPDCVRRTYYNILIVVIVYGAQEMYRIFLFRCPCNSFHIYSLAMILAPTALLLSLGFMASDSYWHAVLTRRSMRTFKQRCNFCLKSLPRLLQPLLAPAVFLISVLFRGDYFVCARIGPQNTACQSIEDRRRFEDSPSTDDAEAAKLYSQSQLLGCGMLAGAAIFTTGIVTIRRICFTPFPPLPDDDDYRLCEEQALETAFRQKLESAVEREARRTVEEAFEGDEGRPALSIYRQACDRVISARQHRILGHFLRLPTHADDEGTAVRIVDSSL